MHLITKERGAIESLLYVLLAGEKLAARISKRQSELCSTKNPKLSRFFAMQSRQEHFHATAFRAALLYVNPKSILTHQHHRIFNAIESRIERALSKGDIAESVLALQIVVETLGENALIDLNAHIQKYNKKIYSISKFILKQEHTHHAFGDRYFKKHGKQIDQCRLATSFEFYLEQATTILDSLAPSFNNIDVNPKQYLKEVNKDAHNAISYCTHVHI